MGFPDRIERTVELAQPREAVWAALTTAEAGDLVRERVGPHRPAAGRGSPMTWTGFKVAMRVERVEEPSVFGFTWQINGLPEDDPRRTYVEPWKRPQAVPG